MKKLLYIDMDGVVADFAAGIKKLSGKDISSLENNDWVYETCMQYPYIFHDLPVIPGAIDAVKELFELYEVYFLSVPMWCVPVSFAGKRIWLEKHFGSLAQERLILTSRKDLNVGDILIDDRLKHGVDRFNGEHVHFGQPPYSSWGEVLPYLRASANVETFTNIRK